MLIYELVIYYSLGIFYWFCHSAWFEKLELSKILMKLGTYLEFRVLKRAWVNASCQPLGIIDSPFKK